MFIHKFIKILRSQDLMWYFAMMVLGLPIILVSVVEPVWMARMIGVGLGYIFPPIALLLFGIFRRDNYFLPRSPLYKKIKKKTVDIIARVIVIAFALFMIVSGTVPYMKDIAAVIRNEAPLTIEEYVPTTRGGSSTGFILEQVTIDTEVGARGNRFSAMFFAPRHIMHDKSYRFIYLPYTHLILDAEWLGDGQILN